MVGIVSFSFFFFLVNKTWPCKWTKCFYFHKWITCKYETGSTCNMHTHPLQCATCKCFLMFRRLNQSYENRIMCLKRAKVSINSHVQHLLSAKRLLSRSLSPPATRSLSLSCFRIIFLSHFSFHSSLSGFFFWCFGFSLLSSIGQYDIWCHINVTRLALFFNMVSHFFIVHSIRCLYLSLRLFEIKNPY